MWWSSSCICFLLAFLAVRSHIAEARRVKCGQHQHFSRKADPCPKTCENHFFGTRRKCYKPPVPEGCRCNKGFILDGALCVKPKHCSCLAKLCLDRESHSKCRLWKAQNRCHRYPDDMNRFCRLTCGMCKAGGRNQIRTQLCEQFKRKGKCSKSFYRMLCRATCQQKKCWCCPTERRKKSNCSKKYKNTVVSTVYWFPDVKGTCKKSILRRFYPCGCCRYRRKIKWSKCNYCKGVQYGTLTLQYREPHGEMRCIRKSSSVKQTCHCPPPGKKKLVRYIKCLHNVITAQITETYQPASRCRRCARIKKQRTLRKLNCRGYFYTGKCKSGLVHIIRKKFQRYALGCRCRTRLIKTRRIMCRCQKRRSRTVCKGDHFLTLTTSWRLKNGLCVPVRQSTKRSVPCKRLRRSRKSCQKHGCKAYRHTSYFHIRRCQCKKFSERKYLGKCCCPRGSKKLVRVNRYWKKLTKVSYILKNYRCHEVVDIDKIRVGCPSGGTRNNCDGRSGVLKVVKYWFKKCGNCCTEEKKVTKSKVECRHDVKKINGRCNILRGNVRYRRVQFQQLKRQPGTCACMKVKQVVQEMCGCRGGKHIRVIPCPRRCTTKQCGRYCFFFKEFYYYKAHGNRCRLYVLKRLRFPCCCRPDRRVRERCRNGRYKIREISYSVLKSHKCQRVKNKSSKEIRCRRKKETKRQSHPTKGLYYLATFHWFVSKCRCRARITRIVCKLHCRKPTKRRFCDPVKRQWVTRRVRWNLCGCNSCVEQVQLERVPVRCSRSVLQEKRCDKKSGILTRYKTWWQQTGCKCVVRTSLVRLRCRCQKPVAGRRYCNASGNAFERKITHWVLSNGRCLKRRRTESRRVKCSRRVRRKSVCKNKKGVKVVSIGVWRPRGCKCELVWSVVHNRRHRCNCNIENKRAKRLVRHYCDKRKNTKVTERYYFALRRGRCVKRSKKSYRNFCCPLAYREKKKCNEARHRQLVLLHYTVKRNCRCVPLFKRLHIKCGCYGKKLTRMNACKNQSGTIVRTVITKRWSYRRHHCIEKKKSTSHQISCRKKTLYINGKCTNNSFYIETKVFYLRERCKCVHRKQTRKRNCHCKNVIRSYKCPRQGYTRRQVTGIRRWDMKTLRCRISRYVTRHIRCRCPKPSIRKYCKDGNSITESTRFALRKERCYKMVTRRSQRIKCNRVLRNRFTTCHGCHRFHEILEQRLNPVRCVCYFAIIRKRPCPCCCPKSTNWRRCARDNLWEHVFLHHAALTGRRCGCRQWRTKLHQKVRCSTKRVYKWLPCNSRSCVSHQQVTYHVARRCKCQAKRRLTGRKRTCCCRTRPRTNIICKASSKYKKRIYYKLKNWRCVRSSSLRFIRHWRCRRKPITKVGRCNTATCRQSVHSLVSVVARPHCRCRTVVRKRHTRLCCCLKRPSRTKKCVRNCWIASSMRFSFDRRRRVCVRYQSRKTSCVRCPKAQRLSGSCNKRSCKRRITHVTYSLKDCRCKKHLDYSYRVCCCPKPSVSGPVCRRNRQMVWFHTSWRLRNGKCMRTAKETRRLVACCKGVTRVLSCNRRTCRQRVRQEIVRVKHCRCRSNWRESERTCCCRPSRIVNTRCERHRLLYQYITTRTLNCRRICVQRTKKHLIHRVNNCRTNEKRSLCNKRTGYVTVHVFHRRPKQCRCHTYRKQIRKFLCQCPGPRVERGRCNKATCHLRVVKWRFTSHGKGDHFKCSRHKQVAHLRCCCKRRPVHRTYCDKISGAIKRSNQLAIFQARSRSCITRQSVKTLRRLVCQKKRCSVGKCSKRTGYKIRMCTHFIKVKSLCKCEKRVKRHRIVCYCGRSQRRQYCKEHDKQVTVHTSWHLSRKLNRCIRSETRKERHLSCPRKTRTTRKCQGCKGIEYIHSYHKRNCRCVQVTSHRRVRCCCPKPHSVKRCMGTQWVVEKVRFTLRNDYCRKSVKQNTIVVACKRKTTHRGKCQKCVRRHETRYYRIRNCKCQLRNRKVRKSRCCCPKPRRFTQCLAGTLRNVQEFWRLCSGKCIKKNTVKSTKVLCHRRSVKAFVCNLKTRHQKIVITEEILKGCNCVRQRRVRFVLCRCKPPLTEKEKCGPKAGRRVYRITYKLRKHKGRVICKPQRRLIYWEPCRCRKTERRHKCTAGGKILKTIVRSWCLCRSHKRRICSPKVQVLRKAIRCQDKSIKWTRCKRFRKIRLTTRHRPIHCKCRSKTHRQTFACNCSKKSSRRRVCDSKRGVIITISKLYFSRRGAALCSSRMRKDSKPVHCSGRKPYTSTRLSRKCGIFQNHGWYTKYLVTWKVRRGCKCINRRKKILKLCRCKRSTKRTKCSRSGRHSAKIRYTYKRIGSVCRLTRTEKRWLVACRRKRAQIRFGGCVKCWRQVWLTQCYVSSCRKRKFRRLGRQRCCIPSTKKKRYCDAQRGRWVTKLIKYRLVKIGPLLKNRNGRVLVPQFKVASRTQYHYVNVGCPRGSTREHCNRRSGKWRKTRTTWHRVGCHCKRRVQRWSGRCRCPTKQVRWGRCHKRYRTKTVISFDLKRHQCVRRVNRRNYICACPKRRIFTVCDRRGHWRTCHVSYQLQFRRQRCLKSQRCRSRRHTCPATKESRGRCRRLHRDIRRYVWRLDKRRCRCTKKVIQRSVECNCHRRNHSRTECKHGAYITKEYTYKQKGNLCQPTLKTTTNPVCCCNRRRSRLIPGSCVTVRGDRHRGYQKKITEWKENHKCKCVTKHLIRWVPCVCKLIGRFRTRKTVKCVRGSVLRNSTVFYKLVRGRCLRKVERRDQPIRCVGTKVTRSKCKRNRYGDTYLVIRVLHRVGNGRCGCVWKHRLLRYKICRCRRTQSSKKCLRNRIWRFEKVTFIAARGSKSCRRKVQRSDTRVHCSKALLQRRSKCRRCRFTVRHFYYKHHKCTCARRLRRVQNLRCCCPKPVTNHHCDASRHMKVTETVSYTLRHYMCYRKRSARTQRVRCGRKRPLYRVLSCHKGYRKIFKTVYFPVACSCKTKKTIHKQRCGCSRKRIYQPGKCGRWFAHDVWFAFKLKATGRKIPGTNKPLLRCVRYVALRSKRRCRCPKGNTKLLCRFHNIQVKVSISYRLRGDSCQRKRTESKKTLSCSTKPRLVRIEKLPRKCSSRNGYWQDLRYVYEHAKNCRCVNFASRRKRICNCQRKYGRKAKVRCAGNTRTITVATWRVRKGNGCAKRSKTSIKILQCKGSRIISGTCGRNDFRTYSVYNRRAKNCGCVWKLVRKMVVPCRCRKTQVTKKCTGNNWVTVVKRWHLVGKGLKAHCKLETLASKRPVACKVGSHLHRSPCNAFGVQQSVVTIRSIRNCLCIKRVKRHSCKCRCRKPTNRRFCRRNRIWVTIRATTVLRNCACFKKSLVTRQPVKCPKPLLIRGPCKRGRKGDKYRTLTQIRWHIKGCKCRRIRSTRQHLCGCDKRRRVHRTCSKEFDRIIKVTERRQCNCSSYCRRIQVSLRRERVRCGRVKVKRVCDKKSGKLSIFVSKPYIKKCRCFHRVTRHERRCGCYRGKKLVAIGKCNRKLCRQRLLFKRQTLSQEKCIWKNFHRHRTCCCKGFRRTSVCHHTRGFVVTKIIKRVLKHWHCVKKVKETIKRIKCKRNLTVRKQKLPRGVLKVITCQIVKRGCNCVRSCKPKFIRYECKKPIRKVVCKCCCDGCHWRTIITSWRLSRGRCLRQTNQTKRPVTCKPNTVTRTRCNRQKGFGYYYVKTEKSWYQKGCKCRLKVRTRSIMCRCLKTHRRSYCQRGHIVRVKMSYRLRRGRCVRIVQRNSRPVKCRNTWRLSHRTPGSTIFYKVFVRFVLSGCRCTKQVRRTPCHSRCPGCTVSHRCDRGSHKVEVKVCWRKIGCQCVRTARTKRRRVHCPKSTRTSRCKGCVRKVLTRRFVVRRCSCILKTGVIVSKCCCPKPRVTRTCVRGSIRVRRVTHKLRHGRCFSHTRDKYRAVNCSRKTSRAIQSKCIRGKQRYNVYFWLKVGCRCVRRVRSVHRECACARKGADLFFVVDSCRKDKHSYKERVINFLQNVSDNFKDTSVRVRTTLVTSAFNAYVRQFKHFRNLPRREFTKSKTNLHTALQEVHKRLLGRARSGVEKVVVIVTCGDSNKRRRTVTMAEKLKRMAKVFVVGERHIPKSGRYIKWLASRPVKLHYMELGALGRDHISATSLFERICKRACTKPRLHRSICHKRTCRRIFTRVTHRYDPRSGKCVRKSRSWGKLCCCIKRNISHTKCRKNRLFRVNIRYSFRRHACHRSVNRVDISARVFSSCRPQVSHRKGPCRRDGWRKDTTVTRQVISCRCRVKRRNRLTRCRCPRNYTRKICERGNRVRRCRYFYLLTPSTCIVSKSCRSSPVTCPRRRNFRGKCKQSSCQRNMGSVWYTVRNCRCKRNFRKWKKTCCCKRKYHKFRHCDKRRNVRIEVQSWYELRRASCRRAYKRIEHPVCCPQPRVERSRCVPKRNGFYRKRLEHRWSKKNCGCVKHTQSRLELCRCQRGRKDKLCRSGSWVFVRHWLQKIKNRCLPRSRIILRRRVTCNSTPNNKIGACRHVKGDRRYAKVVQTWKRRVGCHCKVQRRTFFKLCTCPKPYKRISCQGNNRRLVSVYRYRLYKNSCQLRRFATYRLVRCPKYRKKISKCRGKTQIVKVIIQRAEKCRCVRKVYSHLVSCKAKCRDLLPTKICRKWAANKIQLCDKHPQFAKSLCTKTCHRCYGCEKTRVVFAGQLCLSKQRGFHQTFLLRQRTSFNRCLRSCRHSPSCRAFDYENSTQKCRLLRVHRNGILVRMPWLKLRKTPGCFLFEKICPKKCPFRRIVKKYTCRRLRFGKSQFFYRSAAVAIWRRGRKGRCERRVQRMYVPCSECEDRRPWCTKAKCSKHAVVRNLCKFTCGVCKPVPKPPKTVVGICSKRGWRKKIQAEVFLDKKLHLWRVRVSVKRQRCVRCQIGSYRLVGQCKEDKRKLTKITTKLVRGKCHISIRSKTQSCRGCNLDSKIQVGDCNRRGHRSILKVVTLYTVRGSHRCTVHRSVAAFSCSIKCPKKRISRSKCNCGKRIVCVHYFVTYPGSKLCIPKRHTTSEPCVTTHRCYDLLRPVDCLTAKKLKMCSSMRNLCSRTCGFCK